MTSEDNLITLSFHPFLPKKENLLRRPHKNTTDVRLSSPRSIPLQQRLFSVRDILSNEEEERWGCHHRDLPVHLLAGGTLEIHSGDAEPIALNRASY